MNDLRSKNFNITIRPNMIELLIKGCRAKIKSHNNHHHLTSKEVKIENIYKHILKVPLPNYND